MPNNERQLLHAQELLNKMDLRTQIQRPAKIVREFAELRERSDYAECSRKK